MKFKLTERNVIRLGIAALILLIIINFSPIGAFLAAVADIFAPIAAGIFIAFILNVPLKLLERLWNRLDKKHSSKTHARLRRTVCLLICLLILLGIMTALLFAVIPQLKKSLSSLIAALPQLLEKLRTYWQRLSDALAEHSIYLPKVELDAQSVTNTIQSFLSERGHLWLENSIGMATVAAQIIFDTVLSVVIAVYILLKKEMLKRQISRLGTAFLPKEKWRGLCDITLLCSDTFLRFIGGQLLEAAILGGLCFAGMIILRLPFAALISVLVGITALIPIFGAFIGIASGAFFIFLSDPIKALWFIIFMAVLQQIEGNIIYPKVMGRSMGMSSFWVLIAVTVGSSFGILGIFLSVPIFSILYCLIDKEIIKRHKSPH